MTVEETITLVKECGFNVEATKHSECEKVVLSALEKQIPIKIYPGSCAIKEDFYKVECPECLGSHITRIRPYYCMDCGQRFDWSVIDECIEREKTKKVKFCRKHYRCPSCNGVVVSGGFCKHCGQALDWSDSE